MTNKNIYLYYKCKRRYWQEENERRSMSKRVSLQKAKYINLLWHLLYMYIIIKDKYILYKSGESVWLPKENSILYM